jgi:hypothetical protein
MQIKVWKLIDLVCNKLCVQPTCGEGYHAVQTPYACCPVCVNDHKTNCAKVILQSNRSKLIYSKVACPQLACILGYGLVLDKDISCCPFCVPYGG